MANSKTLKPFKSGYDPRRNTKGRPKGKVSSLEDLLQTELKKETFAYGQIMTQEMAIVMKLIEKARKGETSAFKLFLKYRFGNPAHYCPNCHHVIGRRIKTEAQKKEEAERRRKKKLEEKKKIAEKIKRMKAFQAKWFPKEKK